MNKEINLGNLIIPIIKPQKGKDYYTETEKQELISIVTDNVNAGVLPQEQTRQSNEIIRQNNEQTRQAQETIRQTNETNRQTAETERESAENTRQRNESSRVSAEQTRTQTFNNKMDAVDTAIAGIHTSQNAYDQNATAKTSAFNENATSKTSDYNTNATNKTAEYNENASTKIAEYEAHIRDYEAELATKVDKVAGKGLSTNDFTNEEKEKLAELHNYDDTELSERVDDIEQEQTTQNTNISTNATNIESLQEENENLKSIVAQMPQVTGQGTEVTLENTIEAQFTKFDVEGNSTQETTEGKNKLPNNASSQTINGVKFTVNDDGTVVANGTATAQTEILISSVKLSAGNYLGSIGVTGSTSTYYARLGEGTTSQSPFIANIGTGDNAFTLDETKIIGAVLIIRSGQTLNNVIFKPMIRLASITDDTYEPYTGGIASPNPNYEQPIYSAGDNENLFDTSLLPITKNGVTISKDSKGNVVLNGTPTITSGYINFIVSSKKQLSAGTYTTSFEQKKVGIGSVIVGWGNAYLNLTLDETINKKTATINDNGEAQFNINVRYDVGTLDNFILNPKLEKGNKASGYSPYVMGSINEKISNKNLCKITDFSKAVANVQIKAENNILSFNGTTNNTISANDAIWKNIKLEVKEKGVYTPSLEKSITGVAFGYYKENSSTLISPYSELEVGSYTLGIYVPANTAFNNFTTGVQIEKGSTATSYVEHEEQDYSIFVQQPMRSIGDVRDCFVKVDGVWNEVHYIREKDLGECTWQPVNNDENSRTQGLFTSFSGQNIENYSTSTTTIPKLLSNKYISKPNYKYQYYGRNPQDYTISTFNGNILYIQNSDFSGYTNQQVKEALAGTVLQYVLKNPTYLPCTPEQVEQLENLPSTYKDFTIIQSEDETLAYLEVSGIYDLNKLITRTEVLESEV